jgi:hypothetical protein
MLNTKFKKILTLSATITFTIFILFFMIFNILVLSKYYKYKSQIITYVQNINKINDIADSIVNGQTINVISAKKLLPEAINSLTNLNTNIKNYPVENKYKNIFLNLSNGVNYNILMYKQLLAIVNNPDATDINSSLNNITAYKNSCNTYYTNIKSTTNSFSLPKQNDILVTNTSTFVSALINAKKNQAIINTQNLEFENNLQDIFSKFTTIKCNLYYYVECARKNQMSYSDVIGKALKNENNFNDLTEQFSEVNVPENNVSIYTSFKKVLDDYNAYLKSFISAVKQEQSEVSNSDDQTDFSNLYKVSNSKLVLMNKDFSLLKDNFNKFTNDN